MNAPRPSPGFRYRPPALPPLAVRAALAAAGLTLAVFILLPLSELLTGGGKSYLVREISTAPPVRPAPPPPARKPPKTVSKPQLEREQRRLPPLSIAAGLALEVNPGFGDFALDFNLAGGPDERSLVFELDEVDTPPRVLARNPPRYPITAQFQGIEGSVTLAFTVGVDGRTGPAEVRAAEPGEIFVEAARNAVAGWRFQPGLKGGGEVATRVVVTLKFELDKDHRR